MAKKKRFVIFDGNAVVHRAYHALPPLTTKEGVTVNAVYGFATILLKVINELKPDYLAAAFDLAKPTFRHKEYKEYKATRQKTPEDLSSQFAWVYELLTAFDVPYFHQEGYEADDIIGTLVKKVNHDIEKIIVTGDLDELQLVSESTKVYTMKRGFTDTVIYDEKMVKERYGLDPEQFVDFKALKGDPSDNIPGVPGIGEKTAIALISEYNSLDNLYNNLNKLKEKLGEVLLTFKDQAYLSQRLSRIETDISLKFNLEDAKLAIKDREKVGDFFRKMEFKSLMNKIPQEIVGKGEKKDKEVSKKQAVNGKYSTINTEPQLDDLIKAIKKHKILSVDTETTDKDANNGTLVGLCLSHKEGEGWYIPLRHNGSLECLQLEPEKTLSLLKPLLEDSTIQKTGHNLKYDIKILKKEGIGLSPIVFDSMVAAYILNANARSVSLTDLAFSELGLEMVPITKLIGGKKDQICFSEVPIDQATLYAAEDAEIGRASCRERV